MTRKIKFRAWHSLQEKMYPAEELGQDQLTISVDGRGFVNVSGNSLEESIFMKSMIPEQFTGLKDDDGRDIYENNICEMDLGSTKIVGPVCFSNNAQFMIETMADSWPIDGYYSLMVIGDVHNNHDLVPK